MSIDINEVDPGTGYSVAGHLLDELRSAPDGLSAAELAGLVSESLTGAVVGAWLRELRVRGLVQKERVSPGSTRVRWYAAP